MAVIIAGNYYRFKSVSDTDKYLNILTDGNLDDGINVTTYGLDENDLGQVWLTSVYIHGNPMQYLLKSAKDNRFALDRWRINNAKYNNADIYSIGATTEDIYDQVVVFEPSGSYYKIKLAYRDNLYLTVTDENTYGNGHNVAWAAATGGNNQLWLAEPYSSGTGDSSNSSSDYTGILARYTTLSNVIGDTASDYYIIKNIPDNQYGSGIEPSAQFHPACGLNNNLIFNESSDGNKIIDVLLNKYVKKVFGNDCTINNANDVCYYLYGERYNNGDGYDFHPGVDVSYGEGKPVYALYGGEIVCNDYEDHGTISIKPDGLDIVTTYLHMKNLTTKTHVNAGEKIGEQSGRGNTSNTDYPSHLHFEVTPSTQSGYAVPIKSPNVQMPSILPYGYMDGEL